MGSDGPEKNREWRNYRKKCRRESASPRLTLRRYRKVGKPIWMRQLWSWPEPGCQSWWSCWMGSGSGSSLGEAKGVWKGYVTCCRSRGRCFNHVTRSLEGSSRSPLCEREVCSMWWLIKSVSRRRSRDLDVHCDLSWRRTKVILIRAAFASWSLTDDRRSLPFPKRTYEHQPVLFHWLTC